MKKVQSELAAARKAALEGKGKEMEMERQKELELEKEREKRVAHGSPFALPSAMLGGGD